jgi:hypothetical protein
MFFNITLAYPVGDGYYLTKQAITTKVNQPVCLWGLLGLADGSNVMEGAAVNVQRSLDGNTWTTVFTATTENHGGVDVRITPDSTGVFYYQDVTPRSSQQADAQVTPDSTGVFYYRYTYDGNSQYAPCVSDVVQLTVVSSGQ